MFTERGERPRAWSFWRKWSHYAYAVFMLVGLVVLRHAFVGRARAWWSVALVIQIWHHFEHLLLLGQALTHSTLFGAAKPTSILQLIAARVELHLFYNAIVFAPMVAAIFLQYYSRRKPDQPRVPEAPSPI